MLILFLFSLLFQTLTDLQPFIKSATVYPTLSAVSTAIPCAFQHHPAWSKPPVLKPYFSSLPSSPKPLPSTAWATHHSDLGHLWLLLILTQNHNFLFQSNTFREIIPSLTIHRKLPTHVLVFLCLSFLYMHIFLLQRRCMPTNFLFFWL